MKKTKLSAKHWGVMFLCGACWYLSTGTSADGLNVVVPGFVNLYGWDYSLLMTFNTVAGLIGMVFSLILGKTIEKKGAKFVLVLTGIISGLGYFFQGFATSVPTYFITLVLGAGLVNIFSAQCTGPLVANWMPRKRGIAMGVITAFSPICTATYLWLLNALIYVFGFKGGVAAQGVLCIIVALVALVFLKDTPEEAGTTPDNMPANTSTKETAEAYTSPWTVIALLKNKTMWLIAVAYGFMMLANTGVISQMIPRLTVDKGINEVTANTMFSVAAVAGIVLSIVWGWIDEKLGTKRHQF